MYQFHFPDVGEGIHEAEVLEWLVDVGDAVARDQIVVEVQTDKAVVQLPSPVAGRVALLGVPRGEKVRVGQVLLVVETTGAVAGAEGRGPQVGQASPVRPEQDGPRRVLAAPAVRKLARELGIELESLRGSGPSGRVVLDDVRAAARTQPEPAREYTNVLGVVEAAPLDAEPAPDRLGGDDEPIERTALQGLRRRIAERMELAWRVPQVTVFEDVDATKLLALREELREAAERRGVRLTLMPLLLKATVLALREHPLLNASLDLQRQELVLRRYYHIGVATAAPDGLLVPVLRHADRLTLLELAAELERLVEAARARKLEARELSGSTFTISNFGSFGAAQGTPLVNPPEAAILGCGRIAERPFVLEGQLVARPLLPLALSFDHRLNDGAGAGAFLARLRELLTTPGLLMLDLR